VLPAFFVTPAGLEPVPEMFNPGTGSRMFFLSLLNLCGSSERKRAGGEKLFFHYSR